MNKIKAFMRSRGTLVIELIVTMMIGCGDYEEVTPYLISIVLLIFSLVTHKRVLEKWVEETDNY